MTGRARIRPVRPVVVPAGAEILLELRAGGIAWTGVFHLPVAEQGRKGAPARTLCGLPGETFALGGELLELRLCKVCEGRAPASMRVRPKRDPKLRGKPRWKHSRIKPAHLAVLHRLYTEQELSCRAIAELVYERLGYKTARSCGEALYKAFRAAGYQLRSQSEATALRNHKHGRKPRSIAVGPENAAYRRWLKETNGRYRPRCAALKVNPPGKGDRCRRPALVGSVFCQSHDPGRREEREAHLAGMRVRATRRETVQLAGVLDQLAPLLAGEAYPATVLARATGVPHGTCSRLLVRRPDRITVGLAARLLAAVELEEAA